MSIEIMSWVWDEGPQDATERFVMLAMADIADDSGLCWPAVATIAARCCMSERNARRVIRKLEDGGWVATDAGAGRNNTNRYRLRKPDIAMSARTNCPPGQIGQENRTNATGKPDTAMSAESSRTIKEPSDNKSRAKTPRRAVSLPDGWVPSDRNIDDARKRNFTDEEINEQAERFRDYHIARGTTFKDWDAGWRTWLGNVRRWNGAGSRNAGSRSAHDIFAAGFLRAASRGGE